MELIEKNGKYYQECQVVILATEGKQLKTKCTCEPTKGLFDLTEITEHSHSCGLLEYNGKLYLNGDLVHLYITKSEEIKEGDKVIHKDSVLTISVNRGLYLTVEEFSNIDVRTDTCFKIIASTDNSLKYYTESSNPKRSKDVNYINQLPKEFIESYIKSYNEGSPISKVLVQVIKNSKGDIADGGKYHFLKLNENIVIIEKKEQEKTEDKVYTEEEIIFGVRKMLVSENIKFHYVREELPKFLEEAKKEIISFKTNLKK